MIYAQVRIPFDDKKKISSFSTTKNVSASNCKYVWIGILATKLNVTPKIAWFPNFESMCLVMSPMLLDLFLFVRCLYCSCNWESVLDSFWNTCHRRNSYIQIQPGKGNPYFGLCIVHTQCKTKRMKKLNWCWLLVVQCIPIHRWWTNKMNE